MAENSKIEWCDHTASPWYGCSHVHAGCDHCYAETMAKRNPGTLGIWGDGGIRTKSKSFIANLRKWNREGEATGVVQSVFPSICDPFEDRPELEPWRQEMFATIDECPWVRLLLLTKRPENVLAMWPKYFQSRVEPHIWRTHRPNVWIGTSVSDQTTANKMIPSLLNCHSLVPVLFVSAEPLLGPIDLTCIKRADGWTIDALRGIYSRHHDEGIDHPGAIEEHGDGPRIHQAIAGGESGHGARPMHPAWACGLRDQCVSAGVKFFFKQWGEWVPRHSEAMKGLPVLPLMDQGHHGCFDEHGQWRIDEGTGSRYESLLGQDMYRVGKKAAGRMLDGRTWDEFPEVHHAST